MNIVQKIALIHYYRSFKLGINWTF